MTDPLFSFPAPDDARVFEHLCLALFKRVWKDERTQQLGVSGQNQGGIDIWGRPDRGIDVHAVQCKVRAGSTGRLAYSDVVKDLAKADQMQPSLNDLIFATTARRDAKLQAQVLKLTQERLKQGRFPVTVLGWEDLLGLLAEHRDIAEVHFAQYFQDKRRSHFDDVENNSGIGGSQRSARLRTFQTLVNEGKHENRLEISEMAEHLGMQTVSRLEDYFTGRDEPPIELLKQLALLYCVNFDWLLHGKGEPFYHSEPFFFEAQESLLLIRTTKPEQIFFVRSSSKRGECIVVLRYNDWRYHCLNSRCQVSSHVGAAGSSQLLSLFTLIEQVSKSDLNIHCVGETLEPAEFTKLLEGECFPGAILGKRRAGSPWWDALLDLNYKYSTKRQYKELYGSALVDAHTVIREQIAKVAAYSTR